MSKEEIRAKLLAEGFEPDDLVWIPAGAPVAVELAYLHSQDESEELRKALDRLQGSWVVKAGAVERKIRAMPGCENFSIAKAMEELPPFIGIVHGSRGGST